MENPLDRFCVHPPFFVLLVVRRGMPSISISGTENMKLFLNSLKLSLFLGLCLGAGWYAYHRSSEVAQKQTPIKKRPNMTVEVVHTSRTRLEDEIELVGSVQALATVQVRARVDGYIQDMPYNLGEEVQHNQPLIQLDPSRNQEMVSQAESALRVAEAQLKARQHARDLAEQEWKRTQKFTNTNVYTDQQRGQITTQLEIAEAEVALAAAQVASARSVWQSRKLELQELEIRAPMSGIIAERLAEPGDLARSDLPLITLVNIETVRVLVNVSEMDYRNLELGQRAVLRVDALPGQTFEGRVHRKAPVLDPTTRTAVLEIEVPNTEFLLKPGMHARATVVSSHSRDAITIPTASLVDRDGRSVVYIFDQVQGIVKEQAVQTGAILSDFVEILAGIGEDTPVVRLGSSMVEDGQEVAVNWGN